jgi:hypothetical protein
MSSFVEMTQLVAQYRTEKEAAEEMARLVEKKLGDLHDDHEHLIVESEELRGRYKVLYEEKTHWKTDVSHNKLERDKAVRDLAAFEADVDAERKQAAATLRDSITNHQQKCDEAASLAQRVDALDATLKDTQKALRDFEARSAAEMGERVEAYEDSHKRVIELEFELDKAAVAATAARAEAAAAQMARAAAETRAHQSEISASKSREESDDARAAAARAISDAISLRSEAAHARSVSVASTHELETLRQTTDAALRAARADSDAALSAARADSARFKADADAAAQRAGASIADLEAAVADAIAARDAALKERDERLRLLKIEYDAAADARVEKALAEAAKEADAKLQGRLKREFDAAHHLMESLAEREKKHMAAAADELSSLKSGAAIAAAAAAAELARTKEAAAAELARMKEAAAAALAGAESETARLTSELLSARRSLGSLSDESKHDIDTLRTELAGVKAAAVAAAAAAAAELAKTKAAAAEAAARAEAELHARLKAEFDAARHEMGRLHDRAKHDVDALTTELAAVKASADATIEKMKEDAAAAAEAAAAELAKVKADAAAEIATLDAKLHARLKSEFEAAHREMVRLHEVAKRDIDVLTAELAETKAAVEIAKAATVEVTESSNAEIARLKAVTAAERQEAAAAAAVYAEALAKLKAEATEASEALAKLKAEATEAAGALTKLKAEAAEAADAHRADMVAADARTQSEKASALTAARAKFDAELAQFRDSATASRDAAIAEERAVASSQTSDFQRKLAVLAEKLRLAEEETHVARVEADSTSKIRALEVAAANARAVSLNEAAEAAFVAQRDAKRDAVVALARASEFERAANAAKELALAEKEAASESLRERDAALCELIGAREQLAAEKRTRSMLQGQALEDANSAASAYAASADQNSSLQLEVCRLDAALQAARVSETAALEAKANAQHDASVATNSAAAVLEDLRSKLKEAEETARLSRKRADASDNSVRAAIADARAATERAELIASQSHAKTEAAEARAEHLTAIREAMRKDLVSLQSALADASRELLEYRHKTASPVADNSQVASGISTITQKSSAEHASEMAELRPLRDLVRQLTPNGASSADDVRRVLEGALDQLASKVNASAGHDAVLVSKIVAERDALIIQVTMERDALISKVFNLTNDLEDARALSSANAAGSASSARIEGELILALAKLKSTDEDLHQASLEREGIRKQLDTALSALEDARGEVMHFRIGYIDRSALTAITNERDSARVEASVLKAAAESAKREHKALRCDDLVKIERLDAEITTLRTQNAVAMKSLRSDLDEEAAAHSATRALLFAAQTHARREPLAAAPVVHSAELTTLRSMIEETEALEAAARRERDAFRDELDNRTVERDSAIVECNSLRSECEALRSARSAASTEHESLHAERDAVFLASAPSAHAQEPSAPAPSKATENAATAALASARSELDLCKSELTAAKRKAAEAASAASDRDAQSASRVAAAESALLTALKDAEESIAHMTAEADARVAAARERVAAAELASASDRALTADARRSAAVQIAAATAAQLAAEEKYTAIRADLDRVLAALQALLVGLDGDSSERGFVSDGASDDLRLSVSEAVQRLSNRVDRMRALAHEATRASTSLEQSLRAEIAQRDDALRAAEGEVRAAVASREFANSRADQAARDASAKRTEVEQAKHAAEAALEEAEGARALLWHASTLGFPAETKANARAEAAELRARDAAAMAALAEERLKAAQLERDAAFRSASQLSSELTAFREELGCLDAPGLRADREKSARMLLQLARDLQREREFSSSLEMRVKEQAKREAEILARVESARRTTASERALEWHGVEDTLAETIAPPKRSFAGREDVDLFVQQYSVASTREVIHAAWEPMYSALSGGQASP